MVLYISLITAYPGVAQLVARLTGGQEAVSSSLATRTKPQRHKSLGLTFYLSAGAGPRPTVYIQIYIQKVGI